MKKKVVHILAGEIRIAKVEAQKKDEKLNIRLSWSPKGVAGENAPHGNNLEK